MKKSLFSISFFIAFIFINNHVFAQNSGIGIVNGGSSQGQLTNVPGMDCISCQYITKTTSGFWRMRILPIRVSPWSQNFVVDIQYGIDKPSKIKGLNTQGGENIYDLSEFVNKLDRVSIDFEIVSEMTTPVNGSKEIYVTRFKADRYGEHTVKTNLLTFRATALLDSLYRMSSKYQGDINTSDFQSKFKFRIVSITAKNGSAFGYTLIDKELGSRLEKVKTDTEFQRLIQEAKNSEATGNIDNAIMRYEEALAIKNDNQVRQSLATLKEQKQRNSAVANNSGVGSNTSQSGTSSSSETKSSTEKKSSSSEEEKKTESRPVYVPETPVERLERERGEREKMAADVAPGLVAISDAFTDFIGSSLNSVEITALYTANSNLSNLGYKLTFGFGSKELPEAGHVFGISGGLGFAKITKGSVYGLAESGNTVRKIDYYVNDINTYDYPSIYSLGANFMGYLPNSSWMIGAQVDYNFFKFSDSYIYEWNSGGRNIESELTRNYDNSYWSYGISLRRPLAKIIGDNQMTKTTSSLFLQGHLNFTEGTTKMTFNDDDNALNTYSRLEELPNREFKGYIDYGISLVFRINIRMNK